MPTRITHAIAQDPNGIVTAFPKTPNSKCRPSKEQREFITLLGGRRGGVARSGACAAAGDEFLKSPRRNYGANTGIPAWLDRVINTPERNS